MISKREFEILLNEKFVKEQTKFERVRAITIAWIVVFSCLIIAAAIICHFVFDPDGEHVLLNILISIALWLGLAIAPTLSFRDKFLKKVKKLDLEQLLEVIYGDNVEYDSNGNIDKRLFDMSGFFVGAYDKFGGEDHFSVSVSRETPFGVVSTNFEASDVSLEKIEKDKNGETSKKVFSGVVCAIKFRKPFDCILKMNCAQNTKLENLETESSDFNKIFSPKTDNQVKARLILSVTMMQTLLDFQAKAKCKIGLSFVDNYLFVNMNRNLFEFSKKDGNFDFKFVEPIYDDLALFDALITEITNNRKIFRI